MITHLIFMTNCVAADRLRRELRQAGVHSIQVATPDNVEQIRGMEYCSAEIIENDPTTHVKPQEAAIVYSRVRSKNKVTGYGHE